MKDDIAVRPSSSLPWLSLKLSSTIAPETEMIHYIVRTVTHSSVSISGGFREPKVV